MTDASTTEFKTSRSMCRPRLVGRGAELSQLTDALAEPAAMVLIEGEAGIGKSRMLWEYFRPARRDRHRLVVMCPPFRRPLTLGPVVDAVRAATEHVRGLRLSALAGALRPLFPEWADDLPAAPEPLDDAAAARHRLFRALMELMACLGIELLAIEDVHWADEASLEFLLFMTSRGEHRPRLLVTYRPEDLPAGSLLRRLPSRLPDGGTCERITLGSLDTDETGQLASSMLSGGQVSAELAGFLRDHTDGLPLAIEESVRLLHERRELLRRHGEWTYRRDLARLAVSRTVRDAVIERTSTLGVHGLAVLQAAAVLSEPVTEPVLRGVSALPADAFLDGLADALERGLLDQEAPYGRDLVSFRHTLAARAVYDATPAPRRRDMHLRAARAIEGRSPLPVSQLARHCREAGDVRRWGYYAEQAAELALASGDEAAAAALLHDILVGTPQPADAVVRLLRKIPFLSLPDQAAFRDIADVAKAALDAGIPDPATRADVRLQFGRVLLTLEEYEAGRAAVEEAIPDLTHNPVDAARAMVLLGWPTTTMRPASEHRRWLRRAEPVTAMTPIDRLNLLVDRASALLMLGDEAGWAVAAGLPEEASAPGESRVLVRGNLNIGHMAMAYWGRYQEAERRLARALTLVAPQDHQRDLIVMTQAHLDLLTGAWEGLADRVGALAEGEHPQVLARFDMIYIRGLLRAAAGDAAGAEADLRGVLAAALGSGNVNAPLEPAVALARLRLREGAPDEALDLTDYSIGVIATKDVWIWAGDVVPVRAQALAALRNRDGAADLVTAFARGLGDRRAPGPRASLALCQATLARAYGEHAHAAATFARAAQAFAALPRPYDALLAREEQAGCMLAAGEAEAAVELLSQVHRGMRDLGAEGDAERVAARLREQGVRAWRGWRGGRLSYGDSLSPREVDVVRLVITGRTNREIAESLYLSPKTVARHLHSAMTKLRVSSRTALAVSAVEAGLTPG